MTGPPPWNPIKASDAARKADAGPCEAAGSGALGHDAGPELHLRPPDRVIKKHDLDMFYIAGPGHGGPALVANTYLVLQP